MKPTLKKLLLFLALFFLCQNMLLAQSDTLYAQNVLTKGIKQYKQGQYEEAKLSLIESMELFQNIYGDTHRKIWQINFNLGKNENRLKNYTKGVYFLQKARTLAEELGPSMKKELGYTYLELANAQNWRHDSKNALKNYKAGTAVLVKAFGPESQDAAIGYMRCGLAYSDIGDYRNAESQFLKGLVVSKKNLKPDHPEFNRIYNNLAFLYIKINDFDKAIEYGHKALNIKLLNYDSLHPSVSKYYGNLADAYAFKKDFDKSFYYWNKGIEIDEKAYGKDHPITASTYLNLANVLKAKGENTKALKIYQKSLATFNAKLVPNHRYISRTKKNIGDLLESENQLDKALDLYRESIKLYQSNEFFSVRSIASLKKRIANILLKKGKPDEALLTINEAFEHIIPSFNPKAANLLSPPAIKNVLFELLVFDLLELKSKALYQKHTNQNNLNYLRAAFETSELAIQLIEKMRRSYQSESAREFLNSNTNSLFEQAVEQAYELYQFTKDGQYLYKAFQISEKSKANILWQTLNERYAFETSDIPSENLDSIKSTGLDIADLEKAIHVETDSKNKATLQNQIFDLKQKYEQEINNLEKISPQYYQLKHAANTIDPEVVLQNLSSNSLIIEYFYTSQNLFIFTLSKQGLKGHKVPIDFDLEKATLSLRQNDSPSFITDQNLVNEYISTLNSLYNILFQPIQSEVNDIQNLIIIPHGILQLLSFETLSPPSGTKDFRTLNYLLKNYNIQYEWSAALWNTSPKRITKNTSINFTGFAPGFKTDSKNEIAEAKTSFIFRANESELFHSIPEIENANSYFSGKTFTDEMASESKFMQWAPQSKIIHLATHGIANDRLPLESGLLFSTKNDSIENGFLSMQEIYKLNLSADLAVMSACNTGYGQLAKGEGIMSLGRAFMYAGCKSVITSLWLANDESTSVIMHDFYKYSADGMSKNEALKNAKLNYLQQADPLTAHPHFWANLVAVGDMTSLQAKSSFPLSSVALLFAGAILVFFFFKMKLFNKKPVLNN